MGFIGSRCSIVEGAFIGKETVPGANVVIANSTKIIDIGSETKTEYKGYVTSRSVIIPASYLKKFPASDFSIPYALIFGKRKESTDKKTSLNEALSEYDIPA